MAIAVAAVDAATAIWVPGDSLIRQIVRLAASIAVALGVLAAAAHFLRIPEFREGVAMVMRKLRRAGEHEAHVSG